MSIKLWGLDDTVFYRADISVGLLFVSVLISGIIDGVVFALVDCVFDLYFKTLRFAARVAAKTLINLAVGLVLTTTLLPIFANLPDQAGQNVVVHIIALPNLIILAVYMLAITCLLQLSKTAALWIQTNDLLQILSLPGDAVEEDRIFMFVDLKSSTMHAEQMGAAKYSAFIRDCFVDMTKAADKTRAEIYQYVGDEVIFTWKTSDLNFKRSIEHYYMFVQNLEERGDYYKKHYSTIPQFKAGIHHGRVIRTQVGSLRKSIAFHGDAVNTASRIQGKCNELNRNLLVSTAILDGLPENYSADFEGAYRLRGKNQEVNLFSVHPPAKASDAESTSQDVRFNKTRMPWARLRLNVF
ncbi:MAG TPA: adenylate/guanylate cyclase domain-containing protein [Chryseosolibacter sp.]